MDIDRLEHILSFRNDYRFSSIFIKYVLFPPSGCWEWIGTKDKDGYGMFPFVVGGTKRVHRIAYWLTTGEMPKLLDHIVCDNPACFNPFHVIPSNDRKNVLRGNGPTAINARKTQCDKGHPLIGSNVVSHKGHPNWRTCRICRNERKRLSARKARAV